MVVSACSPTFSPTCSLSPWPRVQHTTFRPRQILTGSDIDDPFPQSHWISLCNSSSDCQSWSWYIACGASCKCVLIRSGAACIRHQNPIRMPVIWRGVKSGIVPPSAHKYCFLKTLQTWCSSFSRDTPDRPQTQVLSVSSDVPGASYNYESTTHADQHQQETESRLQNGEYSINLSNTNWTCWLD